MVYQLISRRPQCRLECALWRWTAASWKRRDHLFQRRSSTAFTNSHTMSMRWPLIRFIARLVACSRFWQAVVCNEDGQTDPAAQRWSCWRARVAACCCSQGQSCHADRFRSIRTCRLHRSRSNALSSRNRNCQLESTRIFFNKYHFTTGNRSILQCWRWMMLESHLGQQGRIAEGKLRTSIPWSTTGALAQIPHCENLKTRRSKRLRSFFHSADFAARLYSVCDDGPRRHTQNSHLYSCRCRCRCERKCTLERQHFIQHVSFCGSPRSSAHGHRSQAGPNIHWP